MGNVEFLEKCFPKKESDKNSQPQYVSSIHRISALSERKTLVERLLD